MSYFGNIFANKKAFFGFNKHALVSAALALALIAASLSLVSCGGGNGNDASGSESTELGVNTLTAPDLVGKSWDDALAASIKPIKPIVIYDNQSTAPKGQITSQHPAAGTTIYVDSDGVCRSMEITVSNRDFSVKYENLIGATADEAFAWLWECGVKKENVFRKYKASTTGVGNGCVSSFTYDDGGEVPEGAVLKDTDKFVMTINSYTDSVSVPALGGKSFEQAVELLFGCKLNVGEISFKESGFPDGTVLSQTPAADVTAYYGDTVDLVLSTLAGEFKMPSLLGLTMEEAEQLLNKCGLKLGTVTEKSDREQTEGTVCGQSVKEGEKVYAATVIDIAVSVGGKADDSVDWEASTITIDISESTHLSAGTVELLAGAHAGKKAFAAAGDKYIWSMPIGTEYPEGDEGLELGLLINSGEGYKNAVSILRGEGYTDDEFLIIERESEQVLPAELSVNVLFGTDTDAASVRLFRLDADGKGFSPVGDGEFAVSESGYTEIPAVGKGVYALVAVENAVPPAEEGSEQPE